MTTHLAKTKPGGGPDAELQLKRFRRVLGVLEREGLLPPWRHVYASGGALSDLPSDSNLIRPGIAVFGIDPHNRKRTDLEPALAWRTQIVFLKDHRRGARIGYGGTWRAPRKVRIATLPVGYNDGYRFAFSNKAEVLVRGERCPVVGRVSMDYTTIDVTHVDGAEVGDVVTLLGRDGDDAISAFELARLAQTIPYEILCGMGRRVKRSYVNGGHGAVSGVRTRS